MLEIKKGTFKREVAKIELKDFEIRNIIITSLLEKGYELVSEPLMNELGEQITIYKIEQI